MNPIIFSLNNTQIRFPFCRKLLQKIPESKDDFFNQIYNNHQYIVQSKVREVIFKSYLKYWEDETFPEIDNDNIMEYYQLSLEFGFLEDYFSASNSKEQLFNLYYLINQDKNGKSNKNDIEQKIALDLDDYLTNFSKELSQIDTSTLYNIFYHPERNLKDHDKAYEFIKNIAMNQNKEVLILLGSLDAHEFKSFENKREVFLRKNEHFGFLPQNSEIFLPEIDEKMKNLEQEIQSLNNHIKMIEKENADLKDFKQKTQNLMTNIESLKEVSYCLFYQISIYLF